MSKEFEIVDTLFKLGIKDVKLNEPLKNYTNIKIGGNANIFVDIKSQNQLAKCTKFFDDIKYQYAILGNGTNTLVKDDGFCGAVISTKGLKKIRVCDDGVFAQAGVGLFELNRVCRDNGLSGLEFSYGIPGSVGGAVCMNAGAYGESMSSVVDYVCVLQGGKTKRIKAKNMGFDYRTSKTKNSQMVIVGVKFRLKKSTTKHIEILQNTIFQNRLQRQPYNEPSLGSVFKRQKGFLPISQIIDSLGLKGFCIGGASVSKKHAGFIVNNHSATCQDFLKLVEYIQKKIKNSYGFEPELEIKILGD